MRTSPNVTVSPLLMGGVWFATGIVLAMTSVLTGLASMPGRSGLRFGTLNLSTALGLLFGSLISGRLVDHFGFAGLFTGFGCLYVLVPLAGLLPWSPAQPPTSGTRSDTYACRPANQRLASAVSTLHLRRPCIDR